MGKLRPVGSEKLQGMEKINRILEIARYKEIIPEPVNETVKDTYQIQLADGNNYKIAKEKNGYVIKKSINEGTEEYLEPMKNRKYYSSYSQALKRLNLITKEVNSLVGNDSEISLFGEQKKFTLKTPKPAPAPAPEPAPAPAPSPEMSAGEMPSPDMGSEEMPSPDMGSEEMPSPDMGSEDMETPDMGAEGEPGEEVTMKSIQKLTGKLGQKIRQFSQEQELTSNDAKYVINSILSAIDLTKLEPEDMEEIMSRLEGEDEGMEGMGNEEMPNPEDMGDEDMSEPPTPPSSDELGELFDIDDDKGGFGRMIGQGVTKLVGDSLSEDEDFEYKEGLNKIIDNIFSESKVEKILTKYFDIDEKEKRIIESKNKKKVSSVFGKVKPLCETFNQENTSKKLIQKYPEIMFVGKTSKKNLLFQLNESKVKITPEGKIL